MFAVSLLLLISGCINLPPKEIKEEEPVTEEVTEEENTQDEEAVEEEEEVENVEDVENVENVENAENTETGTGEEAVGEDNDEENDDAVSAETGATTLEESVNDVPETD